MTCGACGTCTCVCSLLQAGLELPVLPVLQWEDTLVRGLSRFLSPNQNVCEPLDVEGGEDEQPRAGVPS